MYTQWDVTLQKTFEPYHTFATENLVLAYIWIIEE